MTNIVNLDAIIHVAGGSSTQVPGEEKLITSDLTTSKAIEKTLFVRVGGNFQDYIVANNRNPVHNVSASALTYYVHDTLNSRTLSIEIGVIDVNCPAGNETKVAESLHGRQAPGQIFVGL